MRISDWSSDVCSSDLWWSLICTEGDFGEEPIDFLMTENFRQRTALDRAGKCSGWIVGPEPLFLQKDEKAPQRRCLPGSGSSRKRCQTVTKFRQIVPVHIHTPAYQNQRRPKQNKKNRH